MVNFPGVLDNDSTLLLAVDNLQTELTSDIDDSTLTIPVVTTSGFPSTGFITIPDDVDITKSEKISYNSTTATTFSATARGVGNTPASSHTAGTEVKHTIVSDHHNELKDAVKELEFFVGVSGSENFIRNTQAGSSTIDGVNVNSFLTVSGEPVVTGTEDPLNIGSVNATDSLTVSGTPVATGTGGGSSNIDDINGISSGSITVTGTGGIESTTQGNVITLDGSGVSGGGSGGGGTTSTVVSGHVTNDLDTTFDPVALWLFNGDLTDSSGNGHILDQGDSFQEVALANGLRGVRLESGTEYLGSVGASSLAISGALTLEVVLHSDVVGTGDSVFLRNPGEGDSGDVFYQFGFQDRQLRFGQSSSSAFVDYLSGSDHNILEGGIYHLVVVRDSSIITFYVNGEQFGDPSPANFGPSTIDGSTSRAAVGGFDPDRNGILSAKILDRALSAEEIREEYERTLFSPFLDTNSEITVASGTFTDSLTVSGTPVATGTSSTGGGGGSFGNSLFHAQDEKAQNTAGGSFSSGAWRTRDLNTVKTNEITGASLSSNQITLPAGDYHIEWSAPGFDINRHQTRFQDVTNNTTLVIGTSEFTRLESNPPSVTRSLGSGRFTLAGQATVELQHQAQSNSQANNGLGVAANFITEVYSIVKIWKIG